MMVRAEATDLARSDRLGPRAGLILALFALAMFLPGFFTLPPIDRDEVRFAQSSRQMLESGDFVDIRFQDQTRYKKPIGIYWLQSAGAAVLRTALGDDAYSRIWVYRLPSLIAGVASVVLTAAIGAVLFSRQVGFVAGLLMALCLVLNMEARLAKTDATLLACILTALYALARAHAGALRDGRAPIGVVMLGWSAVGAGILVKGPIIVLVLAGTLLALSWRRTGPALLTRLHPRLGIPLCALIVLPWLLLIHGRTQGAFLQESIGHDLISKLLDSETAGRLPPGFHVLMLWIGFWPGSLLVVLALPWMWSARQQPGVRFCLAWAIPTWIAFELPMTKLFHYVLPAYPALAILTAAWLDGGCRQLWPAFLRRTILVVWSVLTAGICLAVAAVPFHLDGRIEVVAAVLALLVAVLLAAVPWLIATRARLALAAMALSGPLFMGAAGIVLPRLETPFLSRSLVAALPMPSGCERRDIISAGFEEPSLVFLTSAATRFTTGPGAADALAAAPCVVAIIEKRQEGAFQQRSTEIAIRPVPVASVEGINHANSRRTTLTVYVSGRPKS